MDPVIGKIELKVGEDDSFGPKRVWKGRLERDEMNGQTALG